MIYHLHYIKTDIHRCREYYSVETRVISNLKDAINYNVYYIEDINGRIIVDNRAKYNKMR